MDSRSAGLAAVFSMSVAAASLTASAQAPQDGGFLGAYNTISKDDLAAHIKILASDDFEGREPGTEGERKTIDYLARAFAQAGAKPGVNGSYFQDVPLMEMRRDRDPVVEIAGAQGTSRLTMDKDFVAFAGGATPKVNLRDAAIVFAGYGIDAPEQQWNDYAALDVRDKVVIVLRGEPSKDGDETLFKGAALTRHGIQPSKYETAAKHGARAVIMIHTDKSAGYPWSVLTGGGVSNAQQFIDGASKERKVELVVHVNEPAARQLFARAGLDFDDAMKRANARGFRAMATPLRLTATYSATQRSIRSKNVIATIPGSGAADECILYTAHWDHVGRNDSLSGDKIFNGAVDNATGTAALIELAAAYAALPTPPRRRIVFIATTAEEKGLLGAEYHADHPVCSLAKTAAVLNLDAHFPFGSFKAMTVPGIGSSEIEDVMAEAAARLGRILQPDSEPQAGAYYRSDHYPFAKRGVPAIYAVGTPRDSDNLPPDHPVLKRFIDYVTNKYHKVSDEYDASTWDLRGVEEDVKVYFETGLKIANDTRFPNWRVGNEFRKLRDDMRRGN